MPSRLLLQPFTLLTVNMAVRYVTNEIDDVRLGTDFVSKLYLGTNQVWPTNPTGVSQVGNGLVLGYSPTALITLNSTQVAVVETTGTDEVHVFEFDGSDWSEIGTPFVLIGSPAPRAARLNADNTMAVFAAAGTFTNKLTWDGATFSLVGTQPAGVQIQTGFPPIVGLTTTTIAGIRVLAAQAQIDLFTHNGTSWSNTGTPFIVGSSGTYSCGRLSDTTVAVFDNVSKNLRTYSHSAGVWSAVGSAVNIAAFTGNPTMAVFSNTRIGISDSTDDNMIVFDWDGGAWAQVGSPLTYLTASGQSITAMTGTTFAATGVPTNGTLTMQQFTF